MRKELTVWMRVAFVVGVLVAMGACSDSSPFGQRYYWEAPEYAGRWGTGGAGDGEFSWPADVAVAATSGDVYVSDCLNGRVQYFTAAGSFLGKWSLKQSVQYLEPRPWGLAVAADGTIYVSDNASANIQHFSASGALLGKWGKQGPAEGEFSDPRGLAAAAAGTVYVADYGNNRVQYFTASGSFLGKWGSYGSGEGQFRGPADVGVTADGSVYVTDHNNSRIQYFTADGSFLGGWGAYGAGEGEFNYATGVAASPSGPIYVTDAGLEGKVGNDRVQVFTRGGDYLGQWGGHGAGEREFDIPNGVAVSAGGTVYIADAGNDRVGYYR